MQVPIINGIYTDENSDYRTSYPRNLIPVPKAQGVSKGYLRPAYGIKKFGETDGIEGGADRGAIEWNGVCYRVIGSNLYSVDRIGALTLIGDVGGKNAGYVTMDYSFTYLAIASDEKLFLYDRSELKQVTDGDLGKCIDVVWLDGYFVSTDGEFIVVSDLDDPFAVNPFKYGSSEIDPDPVVAVLELRNEIAAVNKYTIEFFDNIGGGLNEFPFQRIDGAQLERGAVGTHAVTVFSGALAFVGRGRKEAVAVWIGKNGTTTKVSTREIEQTLSDYSDAELQTIKVETMVYEGHENLYIHLSDQTLVYDLAASQAMGVFVWYTLDSGLGEKSAYRARNFVRAYDKWICGDLGGNIGELTYDTSSHYGQKIGWEFITQIIWNEGKGFLVRCMELAGLTGRAALGDDPTIYASYSNDGESWSLEAPKKAGKSGQRNKRLEWRRQGMARQYRMQKFRGTSDAHLSVARLDMTLEPLAR